MTFDLSAKPSIYFLVWSCLIIQTGSISFLRKFLGIYLSPVVFVLSAILVTLFLLSIAKQKSNDVINNREKWAINQRVVIFSVFVVLLLIGWFLLKSIIPNYPIDPSKSDIIPQVKILAGRFVSGEEIYTPITEFGYLLYPTYLPLTWLPFVIADWMHIDYRFWAYLIFSACVLTPVLWIKRNFPGRILVLLLPFAVFFSFFKGSTGGIWLDHRVDDCWFLFSFFIWALQKTNEINCLSIHFLSFVSLCNRYINTFFANHLF